MNLGCLVTALALAACGRVAQGATAGLGTTAAPRLRVAAAKVDEGLPFPLADLTTLISAGLFPSHAEGPAPLESVNAAGGLERRVAAAALADKGLVTKSGNQYSAATVSRMLLRERV